MEEFFQVILKGSTRQKKLVRDVVRSKDSEELKSTPLLYIHNSEEFRGLTHESPFSDIGSQQSTKPYFEGGGGGGVKFLKFGARALWTAPKQ